MYSFSHNHVLVIQWSQNWLQSSLAFDALPWQRSTNQNFTHLKSMEMTSFMKFFLVASRKWNFLLLLKFHTFQEDKWLKTVSFVHQLGLGHNFSLPFISDVHSQVWSYIMHMRRHMKKYWGHKPHPRPIKSKSLWSETQASELF